MPLPARFRHILHIQLDTAVPIPDTKLTAFVADAIADAAKATSVESPMRDVQHPYVEHVSVFDMKRKK